MLIIKIILVLAMGSFTMISCGGEMSTTENPPLLKISSENLEGLDQKQWSDMKEIDGKKTRILLRNEAVFTLPVWWGNDARPKEGEIFVLEIDYKDVVSNPFIVFSFGNCKNSADLILAPQNDAAYKSEVGRNTSSMSELHRISGENTSKWQTALVPVSWDYLYAGEGNPQGRGKQEFGIKLGDDDKDLPVSEIRIRKATKEDEVRYNDETRAWIKKSQQKYYIKDSASIAKLSDIWKSKKVVPYSRNYLTPILPSDVPDTEEAGAAIKVRMAMNEIECEQLGVYANGKDLRGVSISLSELKNDKGDLFKGKINLYTVEYAFVKKGAGPPKIDAQRIWPLFETPVKAGNSQAFWLTFETEEGSANQGFYKGEINIKVMGNTKAKVPVEIEVMPLTLLTMDESGLSMGGCVTGLVPFHDISYAVKNNVNATNLWFISAKPAMSKVDGKLVLDFTLIDEWMKEAKRLGWQNIVYFLGGNPYGFPRTMRIEQELFVLMQDEGDREARIEKFLKLAADESNRGKVLEEIRGVYAQWIKEVSEHAVENDWPELIFTPFDEPAKARQKPYRKEGYEKDDLVIGTGPWIRTHFIDACEIIRKSALPGTRIYGSIHHPSGIEYLPYVNVFCTNAIHDDPALGDKVRAGKTDKYFWQYTGVGANSEPAKLRYSYGFYFGAYNSRGSLLWAYNWGARFNTVEGNNWMICWDTPFSTIPTLSFEGLREAWDDRRYIETLKKAAKSKEQEEEVQSFLDNIFNVAVHSKTEGGEDTVNDFWNETKDQNKLDEWRFSIADKIIKMSN